MRKKFWHLTRDEIHVREFEFAGEKLELSYFLYEFEDKEKIWGEEVEVLPSIYCWRKTYLPKRLRKYEKYYLNIMQIFFNRDLESFFIETRNRRNYFDIKKTNFPQLGNKVLEDLFGEYEKVDTYVETEKLPYPGMLHNGCKMWSVFSKLGLYDGGIYSPLSGSQVLKVTSYIENLNNTICKNSKCNDFIPKMLNGTFEPIFVKDNSRDAISVTSKFEGYYELDEGKHRICAAKRFGLDRIPATVYIEKTKQCFEGILPRPFSLTIPKKIFCSEVLKEYKRIYADLGLNEEDMKELTEKISDEKYIQFVENKTGKSIIELYKERMDKKLVDII